MKTTLYIKEHNITGLKYFGKTVKDPYQYNGSGKYWTNHLNKHGADITTIWTKEFTDENDLVDFAELFSEFYNIVESDAWANLIPETGLDGGATNTGITQSNEWIAKRSEAMVGNTNGKGRPLGHTPWNKDVTGYSTSKKGSKLTPEAYNNVTAANAANRKGKTMDEIYGPERAAEIRSKNSEGVKAARAKQKELLK